MTPYQLGVAVKAKSKTLETEIKFRRWAVWHIAALSRVKRLPDLHKFVGINPERRGLGPEELRAQFAAYHKAFVRQKNGAGGTG